MSWLDEKVLKTQMPSNHTIMKCIPLLYSTVTGCFNTSLVYVNIDDDQNTLNNTSKFNASGCPGV